MACKKAIASFGMELLRSFIHVSLWPYLWVKVAKCILPADQGGWYTPFPNETYSSWNITNTDADPPVIRLIWSRAVDDVSMMEATEPGWYDDINRLTFVYFQSNFLAIGEKITTFFTTLVRLLA